MYTIEEVIPDTIDESQFSPFISQFYVCTRQEIDFMDRLLNLLISTANKIIALALMFPYLAPIQKRRCRESNSAA